MVTTGPCLMNHRQLLKAIKIVDEATREDFGHPMDAAAITAVTLCWVHGFTANVDVNEDGSYSVSPGFTSLFDFRIAFHKGAEGGMYLMFNIALNSDINVAINPDPPSFEEDEG